MNDNPSSEFQSKINTYKFLFKMFITFKIHLYEKSKFSTYIIHNLGIHNYYFIFLLLE